MIVRYLRRCIRPCCLTIQFVTFLSFLFIGHVSYADEPILAGQSAGLTITATSIATSHDVIPRLCSNANVSSIKSGVWSDPSVWNIGRVPLTNDGIVVKAGHSISYNVGPSASSPRLRCLEIQAGGRVEFATNQNTSLWIAHILVMPEGTLLVGSADNQILSPFRSEIVILDAALETGTLAAVGRDPFQFGGGILAFGRFESFGRQIEKTFTRSSNPLATNDTTIEVNQIPRGWLIGDKIFIPPSNQLGPTDSLKLKDQHWEYRTIQSITQLSNGHSRIALDRALTYAHPCARLPDNTNRDLRSIATLENGEKICTHIANISRNIEIRSERQSGVRGHILLLHRALARFRYTAFSNLGRTTTAVINSTQGTTNSITSIGTNQLGRYSIHFHHYMGLNTPLPEMGTCQGELLGNAVLEDSPELQDPDHGKPGPKWGITIHGTSYTCVNNNAVVGIGGAGIVAGETGAERENKITNNFVGAITGAGGDNLVESSARTQGLQVVTSDVIGVEGTGIWTRTLFNYMNNNVIAGAVIGMNLFEISNGDVRVPLRQGADPMGPESILREEFWQVMDDSLLRNTIKYNETYGDRYLGQEVWAVPLKAIGHVSWNNRFAHWKGIDGVKQDWLMLADPDSNRKNQFICDYDPAWGDAGLSYGFHVGSGYLINGTWNSTNIIGCKLGITDTANNANYLDTVLFWNYQNFNMRPNSVVLKDVLFKAISGTPFQSLDYNWQLNGLNGFTFGRKQSSYQAVTFDDGQKTSYSAAGNVFSEDQAPDFVIPGETGEFQTQFWFQGCDNSDNGVDDGTRRTNRQCWALKGRAMEGEVASGCKTGLCTDEILAAKKFGMPHGFLIETLSGTPLPTRTPLPRTPTPAVTMAVPVPTGTNVPTSTNVPTIGPSPLLPTPASIVPPGITAPPIKGPNVALPPSVISIKSQCRIACQDPKKQNESANGFVAVFSYNLLGSSLSVTSTADNYITVGESVPTLSNIPRHFEQGIHVGVFSVESLAGNTVTWNVNVPNQNTQQALVTKDTPLCGDVSISACLIKDPIQTHIAISYLNKNIFPLIITQGVCNQTLPQSDSGYFPTEFLSGKNLNSFQVPTSEPIFWTFLGQKYSLDSNSLRACSDDKSCWLNSNKKSKGSLASMIRRAQALASDSPTLKQMSRPLKKAIRAVSKFPNTTYHCPSTTLCLTTDLNSSIKAIRDMLSVTSDATPQTSAESLRRSFQKLLMKAQQKLLLLPATSFEPRCAQQANAS